MEGINRLRADNGLSALASNSTLVKAAKRYVLATAGEGRYPAGGVEHYLEENGYSAAQVKNSGYGNFESAEDVLQNLGNSSFVTESGFDQIGIAYLEHDGQNYWAIVAAESAESFDDERKGNE